MIGYDRNDKRRTALPTVNDGLKSKTRRTHDAARRRPVVGGGGEQNSCASIDRACRRTGGPLSDGQGVSRGTADPVPPWRTEKRRERSPPAATCVYRNPQ